MKYITIAVVFCVLVVYATISESANIPSATNENTNLQKSSNWLHQARQRRAAGGGSCDCGSGNCGCSVTCDTGDATCSCYQDDCSCTCGAAGLAGDLAPVRDSLAPSLSGTSGDSGRSTSGLSRSISTGKRK